MSLKINASIVRNVVDFKIDRQSMEAAKKAIKSVADFGNKQKIHAMKFDKVHQANLKGEKQITQITNQRMKQKIDGTAKQSSAEKQAARDAAQAAKRADTADIKRRNTALQLGGIIGKTADEEAKVLSATKLVTHEYEKGEKSLARMNFEIREQIALLRRAARARAVANAEGKGGAVAGAEGGFFAAGAKDFVKKGSISEGVLGGAVGAGALGAVGAGAIALGVDAGIETVRKTQERNQQIVAGGKLVHANPNAIQAMALWGQQNGVDSARPDKIIDNLNFRVA